VKVRIERLAIGHPSAQRVIRGFSSAIVYAAGMYLALMPMHEMVVSTHDRSYNREHWLQSLRP